MCILAQVRIFQNLIEDLPARAARKKFSKFACPRAPKGARSTQVALAEHTRTTLCSPLTTRSGKNTSAPAPAAAPHGARPPASQGAAIAKASEPARLRSRRARIELYPTPTLSVTFCAFATFLTGSAPGSSAPAQLELTSPLTPPPRPRVDPEDTKNDTHTGAETSPRDKEVWSVGKACWRPK